MKPRFAWWLLVTACGWPGMADAQLQVLAAGEPQRVFAGEGRSVCMTFSNAGARNFAADLQIRVWQASSETAVPWVAKPWKRIQVLSGQAVLESARLDFPAVKAETKFIVQWFGPSNSLVGALSVWVYPTNLLADLKTLTSADGPGVFDPENQLKPVLKQAGLSFMNLEDTMLADFRGGLAIIGPVTSQARRNRLAQVIQRIARKGVAVVWIQPPPDRETEIKPSFYVVPEEKGAVVVAQAKLFADLGDSPKAQLNLINFCKLALDPTPFSLPDLSRQSSSQN